MTNHRPGRTPCGRLIAMLIAATPLAGAAQAQDYPARPVRMVVSVAPGGGTDSVARILAQHLTDRLGQQFVVDNRPGGGGGIAVELVRRATPDGHTLLFSSSTFLTNQLLYKVSYDTRRDLAPVSLATENAYVLGVNAAVPARTLQELVALGKAKPGALNYASSGRGSLIHLTGELFKSVSGMEMVHVPYKGMALAFTDVIAGTVQVAISSAHSMGPHIRAGRIRALGVTSVEPDAVLPGVPPIASVYPGFEVTQWYGMLAPAGTPAPLREKLQSEVHRALHSPQVKARLLRDGAHPVASTPERFAKRIDQDLARWSGIIAKAGLRPK